MDSPLRGSYASALSDAFNNEPQSNRGHCQNSNQQDWVICSLCPAAVLSNDATASSQGNFMKRSRMLKNLCHHMQISSSDIHPKCSTTSHPLCKSCEDRMNKLWKFQGVLDKVGLEISKILKWIEKSIVDDHVMNAGRQQSAFKRVTILKDKIMEGYRNKLFMTQPAFNANNPPVVMRVNKVEVNQDADDVVTHGPSVPSSSSRRTGDDDHDDDEVVEVHSDVMLNVGYEEGCSQQSQEEIVTSSDDDEDPNDESMDFEDPEEMEEVVDHDDDAANVVGVKVEGQGRRATIATASSPERVQIKRETVGNQLLEEDEEDDVGEYFVDNRLEVDPRVEEMDRNMCSVGFTQVNQGGSMVLVGQEEYAADYNEEERDQDQVVTPANACVTPSPLQEKGKLQCNLCSHTIILLSKCVSAHAASVSQMRMHIRSAHKNENLKKKKEATRTKCPRQPKRSNFTCSHCSVTFDTKKSQTEHKRTQHIIHCEICKRPFLPHQKSNLQKHIFSHKNQEEKSVACKAREPGAPRSVANFTCSICQRTFLKLCGLSMHMKTHKNLVETCSLAVAEPQQQDLIGLPRGLKQGIRTKLCKVMGFVPPNGN